MTLHSPQVHGFFSVPVDHLHALRELAAHFRGHDLSRTTVVSPDLGNAKEAAAFSSSIGAQVAAGAKQRFADDRVASAPSSARSPGAMSSSSTTRSPRAVRSSNSWNGCASWGRDPSGSPAPTGCSRRARSSG